MINGILKAATLMFCINVVSINNGQAFQVVNPNPFDISEARQSGEAQKVVVSTREPNATAMLFNADGTKLFIGGGKKEIFEYNLTTAFDLSTATYSGDSEKLTLSNLTNNLNDMAFNNDGTKFFTLDNPNGKVLEYSLNTPYDISSAVFDGIGESLDLIPYDNFASAMVFNASGSKLFIAGRTNGFLHEFNLTTFWDVSTAVHAGDSERFDFTPFTTIVTGLQFNADGSKLFISNSSELIEFDLSTLYDISTTVHSGNDQEFNYDEDNVSSVRFSPDGLQFFTLISNIHGLWRYDIGPFDEIPPQVSSIARNDPNPIAGTSGSWEVQFTEDVTGVDLSDFELIRTGTITGDLISVTASDAKTYIVSASSIANTGSLGLNLKDDDSILDFGGNPLRGVGGPTGDFVGEAYNTNQSPTDITLNNNVIAENNKQNALIGTLTTSDSDVGDSHSYRLAAGVGDDDNTSFLVVSDLLLAADLFDFETKDSYSIRLRTMDSHGDSFEKIFNIEITDANDRPARINLSNNSVEENDSEGALIGTLSTEDQDEQDTFSYTLIPGNGNVHKSLVRIQGDQLLTAAPLDFESLQELNIRIRVTDSGGATNERPFVIAILDIINEPVREFTQNTEGAKIKNFFSPNGDGINDFWVIDEIEDNPDNKVKVYTQAGLLVYSAEGYKNNWDGSFKGTILPTGTYYYEINIRNGTRIITGFLTLMTNR